MTCAARPEVVEPWAAAFWRSAALGSRGEGLRASGLLRGQRSFEDSERFGQGAARGALGPLAIEKETADEDRDPQKDPDRLRHALPVPGDVVDGLAHRFRELVTLEVLAANL
jgi:hypothetical protein